MKIRADEHVSSEIVRAVREMALSPNWEITHVVEEGDGGRTDEHWITRFALDGGNAILSADTDFFRRPVQVLAVFSTGMKVIHLPHKWANAPCHLQAAHILLWWRRIEKAIESMQRENVTGLLGISMRAATYNGYRSTTQKLTRNKRKPIDEKSKLSIEEGLLNHLFLKALFARPPCTIAPRVTVDCC